MKGTELAGLLMVAAALATSSRAHAGDVAASTASAAQGPSSDATAAAQALFVQGRGLVADGRYDEGCEKLEQSKRLDPAPGTEVNLADCYEKSGKLAKAWLAFHEAAAAAQRSGRSEWADQARIRAKLLEPRVPVLTVVIAERSAGLEVHRDGVPVEPSTFDSPVPVNPGGHDLTAAAPGREPWSTHVVVDPGTRVVLYVPPLTIKPSSSAKEFSAPVATGTTVRENRRAIQRAVALSLGASAVVWLGAGAYFGAKAIQDNNEAAALCPASPRCTSPEALALTGEARSAATASTAAFVAGGTVLAMAGGLFLTAPPLARPSLALRFGGSTVSLVGHW